MNALSVPEHARCECGPDLLGRHYLECLLRRDRARAERAEAELARVREATRREADLVAAFERDERERGNHGVELRLGSIVRRLRRLTEG